MSVTALRSMVRDATSSPTAKRLSPTHLQAMLWDLPPRHRLIAAGCGAWCALMLLLTLAFCLWSTDPALEDTPTAAAPVIAPPTVQQLAEAIGSRPLFDPTRRAAAPPVAMPPPVALRDRGMRLAGTYVEGAAHKAFLVSNEHPLGAWLTTGDPIGGWTIADIEANRVDLKADGETFAVVIPDAPGTP